MKIVITTPLYPPEIGKTATYVKELARRLSKKNKVTIVTYGYLPEKIEGVTIIPVNKNLPLVQRLISFTYILLKNIKGADIIYTENGSSVELPISIVIFFTRKPLIIHYGDVPALKYADQRYITSLIKNTTLKLSKEVVTDIPLEKPEVLPFGEVKNEETNAFTKSWENHVSILDNLFKKYGR